MVVVVATPRLSSPRLASKGVISARRHYSFPSRATQFFLDREPIPGVSPPPFHRPAALITRHRGILSWKRETSASRKFPFPRFFSRFSPVSSLPRLSINLFDSFSRFSFHSPFSPLPPFHATCFPEIFRVIRRRRLSRQGSIFFVLVHRRGVLLLLVVSRCAIVSAIVIVLEAESICSTIAGGTLFRTVMRFEDIIIR